MQMAAVVAPLSASRFVAASARLDLAASPKAAKSIGSYLMVNLHLGHRHSDALKEKPLRGAHYFEFREC
jgi:hypothetical protein